MTYAHVITVPRRFAGEVVYVAISARDAVCVLEPVRDEAWLRAEAADMERARAAAEADALDAALWCAGSLGAAPDSVQEAEVWP